MGLTEWCKHIFQISLEEKGDTAPGDLIERTWQDNCTRKLTTADATHIRPTQDKPSQMTMVEGGATREITQLAKDPLLTDGFWGQDSQFISRISPLKGYLRTSRFSYTNAHLGIMKLTEWVLDKTTWSGRERGMCEGSYGRNCSEGNEGRVVGFNSIILKILNIIIKELCCLHKGDLDSNFNFTDKWPYTNNWRVSAIMERMVGLGSKDCVYLESFINLYRQLWFSFIHHCILYSPLRPWTHLPGLTFWYSFL